MTLQKQEYVNPFRAKQLAEYGKDGLNYLNESQFLSKYITRISVRSETGAATTRSRVNRFGLYTFKTYPKISKFDDLILEIRGGKHDPMTYLPTMPVGYRNSATSQTN